MFKSNVFTNEVTNDNRWFGKAKDGWRVVGEEYHITCVMLDGNHFTGSINRDVEFHIERVTAYASPSNKEGTPSRNDFCIWKELIGTVTYDRKYKYIEFESWDGNNLKTLKKCDAKNDYPNILDLEIQLSTYCKSAILKMYEIDNLHFMWSEKTEKRLQFIADSKLRQETRESIIAEFGSLERFRKYLIVGSHGLTLEDYEKRFESK